MGRPVAVANNNVCGARADDDMNFYIGEFLEVRGRDTPMLGC